MSVKKPLAALAIVAACTLTGSVFAQTPSTMPATAPASAAVPYPLTTCIVSGEELGGDMGEPVVMVYEGREIKFCCNACVKQFKADPQKFIKKLDEAAAKAPTTQKAS